MGKLFNTPLNISVATGTAPLAVSSTTVVTNLNADLLDGKHSSDFMLVGEAVTAPYPLTIGSYLTGTSYNGSAAVTIAVDGTTAATASKVAVRDSAGDICARLLRSEYTSSGATGDFFMTQNVMGGTGTDNYVRPFSVAEVRTKVVTSAAVLSGLGSQTAKTFLAAPNGAAGSSTFRAIVASDIPTLNQDTTGNAATATKLATARAINGVNFDGTAAITVADSTKLPLAGGTMTGSLLITSGATLGIGFWASAPATYGIRMSDAATGGRITTETTSDYNIYYAMQGGTNRGHVFGGSTGTAVAQIDGAGTVHAKKGFRVGKYSMEYNGTEDSLDWVYS